jgi:hypothetical protein
MGVTESFSDTISLFSQALTSCGTSLTFSASSPELKVAGSGWGEEGAASSDGDMFGAGDGLVLSELNEEL